MMKREIAEEIFNLLREYCDRLNQSAQKVKNECSTEEFEWYRDGVGHLMAQSYDCIMGPIFKQYPDLEPETWRGEDEEAAEFGRLAAAAADARRRDRSE